jgi:hypothetical protein
MKQLNFINNVTERKRSTVCKTNPYQILRKENLVFDAKHFPSSYFPSAFPLSLKNVQQDLLLLFD